jgi:hypothetical protein
VTERDKKYVEVVFMAHEVYEGEMRAAKRTLKRRGAREYIAARVAAESRRDEAESTAWAAYRAAGRAEVETL